MKYIENKFKELLKKLCKKKLHKKYLYIIKKKII